ncbi:hypothetical protein K438DRAFT_1867556, partial [Mycena galopus ATCC 62051]
GWKYRIFLGAPLVFDNVMHQWLGIGFLRGYCHTCPLCNPPWRHRSCGSAPAPADPSFKTHVTRAQVGTATCTLKYSGSLPCWGERPSATCCVTSPLCAQHALLSAPHDSAVVGEALQRLCISVQPHRLPAHRHCAAAHNLGALHVTYPAAVSCGASRTGALTIHSTGECSRSRCRPRLFCGAVGEAYAPSATFTLLLIFSVPVPGPAHLRSRSRSSPPHAPSRAAVPTVLPRESRRRRPR